MAQLHKKFTDYQVKELIERYLNKEIERKYIQEIFNIGKTRFFALLKKYHENFNNFSIQYSRNTGNKRIPQDVEKNIVKELNIDKKIIENVNTPLR